jgi:cell division septal protein FtsQ
LSQIDVTDVHDAIIVLKDDTALIHVGTEKFIERVQSYIDLIPALRERIPEIDYVDLRFDERVYVRPSRGRRQRGS